MAIRDQARITALERMVAQLTQRVEELSVDIDAVKAKRDEFPWGQAMAKTCVAKSPVKRPRGRPRKNPVPDVGDRS